MLNCALFTHVAVTVLNCYFLKMLQQKINVYHMIRAVRVQSEEWHCSGHVPGIYAITDQINYELELDSCGRCSTACSLRKETLLTSEK